MPSLEEHQSRSFTKLLVTGDSKTGKTGALASLVCAGYKLRILDYDNGLDVLRQFVMKRCPEKIANVEYRTLRDKRKYTPLGPVIAGTPKAYLEGVKMLDRWKYDDVDLGVPAEWGSECILVIDSLTFMCNAAFDFREPLTPRGKSGDYDKRATYKDAQDAIEDNLANLTSDGFETNVLVISHVNYQDNPDDTRKGYPVGVGQKLSPKIPTYFNNYVRFVTRGGKRKIETKSSAMFDLATAKPFDMPTEFDIDNGLAQIFEILRK